ncbi:MAG: LuxR C-terminal-related transcriptional regulator, partial [SAR202 cluster bacterium]|nr:LuxR C-terminal-related transcriptional regulator [SAR202 cluster bacterium]
ILLALDDLHWADQSSLMLLEFLGRELQGSPILIATAHRNIDVPRGHVLSRTVGELTTEPRFQHLQLYGLNLLDVKRYTEAIASRTFPEQFIESVFDRTEGNPFFLTELIRLLEQEGVLAPESTDASPQPEGAVDSWQDIVPAEIREAIRTRLSRLTQSCNEVLTLASIIAREFELGQLRTLFVDSTLDGLLTSLDEALAAGVIEEVPREAGRYRFTHTLIRETIAGEVSDARRAILHGDIGAALEALYTDTDRPRHAAEIAHHYSEAATLIGQEKRIEFSVLAAEHALDTYAYEDVIDRAEAALREISGSSEDRETARLVMMLSRAQAAILDYDNAIINLNSAFDIFVRIGAVSEAISAIDYPYPAEMAMQMTDLLSEALKLVPDRSHQAGHIFSAYGLSLGLQQSEQSYELASRSFEEAQAIAQNENDLTMQMRVLANRSNVCGYYHHWDETLEFADQALALSDRVDDPISTIRARLWRLYALYVTGKARNIDDQLTGIPEPERRIRNQYWLIAIQRPNLVLACARGEWELAREIGERCLAIDPDDSLTLGHLAVVEYETDNRAKGRALYDRMLDSMSHITGLEHIQAVVVTLIQVIADISGESGFVESALNLTIPLDNPAPKTSLINSTVGVTLAFAGLTRDDAAQAQDRHDSLSPVSGGAVWGLRMSMDRLLAKLSWMSGETIRAKAEFEQALEFCKESGYQSEWNWTAYDFAEAMLQSHDIADINKAKELLRVASDSCRELGMTALAKRIGVATENARNNSKPTARATYPDGLTVREIEVLNLIARGQSNKQIAESLKISMNTVMHHVSRILKKTTSANRAEAAIYAANHNLLSD